jgi:hypothetical protein
MSIDEPGSGGFTYTCPDDAPGRGAVISGYHGPAGMVVIPEVLAGRRVIAIGNEAFTARGLTGVVIPPSVASIGDWAFEANPLESLVIPGSVVSIGKGAFYHNRLERVAIPPSVASIGDYAFINNRLTGVVIPGSVISIGSGAFAGNQDLGEIGVAPDNAAYMSIHGVLFSKDGATLAAYPEGQARDYAIPPGVKVIGHYAFSGVAMTRVDIPASVRCIGREAFAGSRLGRIALPASVKVIGEWAFYNNLLESLVIPAAVASIGVGAFFGNPLTSITIGAEVSLGSTWPGNFNAKYAASGKAAGTYTRSDQGSHAWEHR